MERPPFQHLLDAHAVDVHGFLVALLGPVDADDGLQETVLAALRAYPTLRHDGNLRGWLMTIAYREAMDLHRARNRRAVPVSQVPDRAVDDPSPVDHELWAVVDGLPDKQRVAVVGRYRDDRDYADIATELGCSIDAARRSAHEGVKKLRLTWRGAGRG